MLLKIYVDDFKKTNDWLAICQQLKIDATATVITIKVEEANGSTNTDTVVCEGCGKEVCENELSDVMEMNICNSCDFEDK